MCESTALERSSLEGLFCAFRIALRCLMRLLVAVACISTMSRPVKQPPPLPMMLRAEELASVRTFVRTPDVDHSDNSRFGGPPASSSDEQRNAEIQLFGSLSKAPGPDRREAHQEHPWELD